MDQKQTEPERIEAQLPAEPAPVEMPETEEVSALPAEDPERATDTGEDTPDPKPEEPEQLPDSDAEPLAYSNFTGHVAPELLDGPAPEEAPNKEKPIPAFEDPDRIVDPKGPVVYCNFANDYGKDLGEALKEEQPEPPPAPRPRRSAAVRAKRDEKIIIGLMLAVSVLCVGILGVFIYWLETLLKLL